MRSEFQSLSNDLPGSTVFSLSVDNLRRRSPAPFRIVAANGGGPIRLIVNGRRNRPIGRMTSAKCGRAMPVEAPHEADFVKLCEADAEVVAFTTQPHRLEMRVPWQNRALVYFPDFRMDLACGRVRIVETYDEAKNRRASDPDYLLKLELAERIYRSRGWSFERLERQVIEGDPLLPFAREVWRHRRTTVSVAEQFMLAQALHVAGGAMAFPEAAALLGRHGSEKLQGLVARRFVAIDPVGVETSWRVCLAPRMAGG